MRPLDRDPVDRPSVVLVAHEVHDRGGMERVTLEVLRHTANEFRYVVVSRELDPSLAELVEHVQIRVPGRPFVVKYAAFALLAGWKLRSLDGLRHSVGALVPNRVDLATVHYLHAAAPDRPRASGAVLSRLRWLNDRLTRALSLLAERWCYRPRRVRRLAAVSEGVAGECRHHYPRTPVSVTPNGVDLDRFKPDDGARQHVRDAMRTASDAHVAVFVGGDWGRKGLHLAVEALAHVPQLHLWVIGHGDEAPLRRLAAEQQTSERLHFLGQRTDPERWMAAADVFVLPSSYETFSLVAHEAAACGLPLVATPVHGVRELVEEHGCGVLVSADVPSLVAALRRLTDDTSLRLSMGVAGRAAAHGFSWSAAARRTAELQGQVAEAAEV